MEQSHKTSELQDEQDPKETRRIVEIEYRNVF